MAGDRTNAGIARDLAAADRRNSRRVGTVESSVAELSAIIDSLSVSPPVITNVDLGSAPLESGSFTITIDASTVGSMVEIHETAETISATGEEADRLECDQILCQGRVTASTTATIWWLSVPGPVSGIRRFAYRITQV